MFSVSRVVWHPQDRAPSSCGPQAQTLSYPFLAQRASWGAIPAVGRREDPAALSLCQESGETNPGVLSLLVSRFSKGWRRETNERN
jgi:hypothetical protein